MTPLEQLADRARRLQADRDRAAHQRATLRVVRQSGAHEVQHRDTATVQHRDSATDPQALVLVTTVAECTCGAVWPSPNSSLLVRYDKAGLSNSIQQHPADLGRFLHLPRETRTLSRRVHYCEACWPAQPSAGAHEDQNQ